MKPEAAERLRVALADLGDAHQRVADALIAAVEPEPQDGLERLLSIPEAANALGISRSALYWRLRDGSIRSFKVGRRRLIPASAIAEFGDRS